VDHDVFEIESGRSVALSKDAFATAIYDGTPQFIKVDHSAFSSIFQILVSIISRPKETRASTN